jgi:hypothetical protein
MKRESNLKQQMNNESVAVAVAEEVISFIMTK